MFGFFKSFSWKKCYVIVDFEIENYLCMMLLDKTFFLFQNIDL